MKTEKADFKVTGQLYGSNPIAQRKTDLYKKEYVHDFVRKWDDLIDWDARASSEGDFFIRILKERGVRRVLMWRPEPAFIPSGFYGRALT
jgi:hypothetical protein